MDIHCDHCGTSYVFDESRISGEKMRFKCSRCGNVFEMELPAPKAEEEELYEPEEAFQTDMPERAEQMEEEQEPVQEPAEEEERTEPDRSPIIVDGVIGADEAGLDGVDIPDIEIGEPPSRLAMDSRVSHRYRGTAWRLVPSSLIVVLLVAAVLFGIYLTGSTLAPGLSALFPHSIKRFFTRTEQSSVKSLALVNVEGFFSRNNMAGHIYVVKGQVENRGDKPYNNIRIKGILYNKEGVPLMESEVLCGTDISDQDLITLSGDEIYARMREQMPEGNWILQPSKTLPYTVVFIDLPKDIYEYSVRIIGADIVS